MYIHFFIWKQQPIHLVNKNRTIFSTAFLVATSLRRAKAFYVPTHPIFFTIDYLGKSLCIVWKRERGERRSTLATHDSGRGSLITGITITSCNQDGASNISTDWRDDGLCHTHSASEKPRRLFGRQRLRRGFRSWPTCHRSKCKDQKWLSLSPETNSWVTIFQAPAKPGFWSGAF